jgi:hypothetical protein
MLMEETYKKKFEGLLPWGEQIIQAVKKELKNEHLPKNRSFVMKYFPKATVAKLTTEELTSAYLKEIAEGNEEVGEWVASRWVLRNGEIYQFFAQALTEINPKFDEIKAIPDDKGKLIVQRAISLFGAAPTYIFSIFNEVVFSAELYADLQKKAALEVEVAEKSEPAVQGESVEALKERHQKELSKIIDKYEQKLVGFHKKYTQDVDGFKKQIAALQRRLSG